jgi:hypothetical protein
MNSLVGDPASLVYFWIRTFLFWRSVWKCKQPGALAGCGRIVGEHKRLTVQPFCSGAIK